MLLGALVDAGLPFACLEETAAALNVGARLEMRKVSRSGLAATKWMCSRMREQGSGIRDQKANIAVSMGRVITTTRMMSMSIIRTPTRGIGRCRRLSKSFAPPRSPRA